MPVLLGADRAGRTLVLSPGIGILPLLGFLVAAFLAWRGHPAACRKRNPLRAPLETWGMVVAHFGIAVALAGMAAKARSPGRRWSSQARRRPERRAVAGPARRRDSDRRQELHRDRGGTSREPRRQRRSRCNPETRNFRDPPTETNEAAIRTCWDGQLYTVVGKSDDPGRWQLRLWWKPFVTLIWLGGGLVAFGGFLALIGRVRPRRYGGWRRRRATHEAADLADPARAVALSSSACSRAG